MAEWYGRLLGQVELVIHGADPVQALNCLTQARLPFWDIDWRDRLTVSVKVPRRVVQAAEAVIADAMCTVERGTPQGLPRLCARALHRPVLLVFLLLNLAMAAILPQFVFFYRVSGNETVPEDAILRALSDLGVGFGTFGPEIRPQWIKDHLLNILPELQWATVVQSGCLAEVVVRERPETPKTEDQKAFSHVVATHSGLITEMSVLAGQALCEVGDTVVEGQRLVSGLVDLERTYTLVNAGAEIYARTWHRGTTVMPQFTQRKQATGASFQCLWLEVGKHRIKIFGNSGILVADCDKMVERKPLTLPGGWETPVCLVVETFTCYETAPVQTSEVEAQLCLEDYARTTTLASLVAGEILEPRFELTESGGVYRLSWVLECREMIARSVEFHLNEEEFTHDGTNRERRADGASD